MSKDDVSGNDSDFSVLTKNNLLTYLTLVKEKVRNWVETNEKDEEEIKEAKSLISRVSEVFSNLVIAIQKKRPLALGDQLVLQELGFTNVSEIPTENPDESTPRYDPTYSSNEKNDVLIHVESNDTANDSYDEEDDNGDEDGVKGEDIGAGYEIEQYLSKEEIAKIAVLQQQELQNQEYDSKSTTVEKTDPRKPSEKKIETNFLMDFADPNMDEDLRGVSQYDNDSAPDQIIEKKSDSSENLNRSLVDMIDKRKEDDEDDELSRLFEEPGNISILDVPTRREILQNTSPMKEEKITFKRKKPTKRAQNEATKITKKMVDSIVDDDELEKVRDEIESKFLMDIQSSPIIKKQLELLGKMKREHAAQQEEKKKIVHDELENDIVDDIVGLEKNVRLDREIFDDPIERETFLQTNLQDIKDGYKDLFTEKLNRTEFMEHMSGVRTDIQNVKNENSVKYDSILKEISELKGIVKAILEDRVEEEKLKEKETIEKQIKGIEAEQRKMAAARKTTPMRVQPEPFVNPIRREEKKKEQVKIITSDTSLQKENDFLRRCIVKLNDQLQKRSKRYLGELTRMKKLVGESSIENATILNDNDALVMTDSEIKLIEMEFRNEGEHQMYFPQDITDAMDVHVSDILNSVHTGGVKIEIEKIGKNKYLMDQVLNLRLINNKVFVSNMNNIPFRSYVLELYAPFLSRRYLMKGRRSDIMGFSMQPMEKNFLVEKLKFQKKIQQMSPNKSENLHIAKSRPRNAKYSRKEAELGVLKDHEAKLSFRHTRTSRGRMAATKKNRRPRRRKFTQDEIINGDLDEYFPNKSFYK